MDSTKSDKCTWFHKKVIELESPLLKYTLKILLRMGPSEEVVQESFLRLWKQDFPGNDEHYPKAWLYRVCRNLAIDILRKDSRLSLDDNLEEILTRPCISETLFDASRIMQEIATLPPIEQEVLVLKFNDGLTYKEIAHLTGLSVSNVGVKIHDAVKKIRAVVLSELQSIEPTKKGELNGK